MTIVEMLSESRTSAALRERRTCDEQLSVCCRKVVLFGAGRIGRKVAAALRVNDVTVLAFADNDPALAGEYREGVMVLSPVTAARRWRTEALFIVTTFLPTGGGTNARLRELSELGCLYTTSFLTLGWGFDGILPHFAAIRPSQLLEHAEALRRVSQIWSDDGSRETFRRALEWRLHGRFEEAEVPAPNQYFPQDLISPEPNEVFVDGGAFDGDTLRSAPWILSKVIAIEPDRANAMRLKKYQHPDLTIREVILGRDAGLARFNDSGTTASSRDSQGSANIRVLPLDQIVSSVDPTFIKLDVEGDELAALQGCTQTLTRSQPIAAVCVYHRPEDLWVIPEFLRQTLPAHRMFLRSHAFDGFELVAYAIPQSRCRLIS